MAPSGCYIASGDDHGNLRIWACDTPDQIIKLETPLFAGAVLDIAWSGDSQRVLAVGDGGAIFGKVRGPRGGLDGARTPRFDPHQPRPCAHR